MPERMSEYPAAESVSIDARMEALSYALECVKAHYGADAIALRDVAALVDWSS